MDPRMRAFQLGVIRLAKAFIKLWEDYVSPPSDHYPPTPPPEQAVPTGAPK